MSQNTTFTETIHDPHTKYCKPITKEEYSYFKKYYLSPRHDAMKKRRSSTSKQ